MKQTPSSSVAAEQLDSNELLPEYDLDYSKARPNRFAGKIDKNQVVVMLEPDIAEVFTTPESVNAVLRALISTMPARPAKATGQSSPAPATQPPSP